MPTTVQGPLPALLWIHGGGYVLGSADGEDLGIKSIVLAVGCAAISVDYRLAPETPHPGPVEDCYAALKWLFTHAGRFGWRALLGQEPGEPAVSPYAAAARAEYLEGLPATLPRLPGTEPLARSPLGAQP